MQDEIRLLWTEVNSLINSKADMAEQVEHLTFVTKQVKEQSSLEHEMLKSETFYLCKQLQSLKGNGVQVMVVLYCIVLVLVILINSEPFAKESGGFLIAW